MTALQMMHIPRAVHFTRELSGSKSPLFTGEDNEVIVGKKTPAVSFRAYGCTKENDVFGERNVQYTECPHRSACIIEDPLGRRIDVPGVALAQLGHDRVNDILDRHFSSESAPRNLQ